MCAHFDDMYECSVCMDLVSGTYRGQKSSWQPLELALWVVVSHHVGARKGTWVF